MAKLTYPQISDLVTTTVLQPFYARRLERLQTLRLKRDILKRKNPYLFKAKNLGTPEKFVSSALDAYLSSQEETMFGNLMEGLAIAICADAFGGRKAEEGTMKSVDLEFERFNSYHIVGIKSGTSWGNADQVRIMRNNFKKARELLRQKGIAQPIVAVNGCMYGQDSTPFKPDNDQHDPEREYFKYCGQEFWELISGDDNLYVELIKPIDSEAKKRDAEFQDLYDRRVAEMGTEFGQEFLKDWAIDWEKLLEFVSKKSTVVQTEQPPLPDLAEDIDLEA